MYVYLPIWINLHVFFSGVFLLFFVDMLQQTGKSEAKRSENKHMNVENGIESQQAHYSAVLRIIFFFFFI